MSTQDEIIEMAREAGFEDFDRWSRHYPNEVNKWCERMKVFYNLAVAKEREACAKVCEQSEIPIPIDVWLGSTKKEISKHTALALAAAIRARGEQA